jgi:heptaprenyl diphosphate synthase
MNPYLIAFAVLALLWALAFVFLLVKAFPSLAKTNHQGMNTHKIALMGVLLALAIALGIADYYIPFPWVPGAKLGLANIVIVLALYEFGVKEAAFLDLGKVFLVGLLSGRIFQMGFYMSAGGTFLSLLVMILLKYLAKKMTIVGVSAEASIFHGLGQLIVYCLFIATWAPFYYFPFMALIGIATGLLVGLIASRIRATGVLAKQKALYHYR